MLNPSLRQTHPLTVLEQLIQCLSDREHFEGVKEGVAESFFSFRPISRLSVPFRKVSFQGRKKERTRDKATILFKDEDGLSFSLESNQSLHVTSHKTTLCTLHIPI